MSGELGGLMGSLDRWHGFVDVFCECEESSGSLD